MDLDYLVGLALGRLHNLIEDRVEDAKADIRLLYLRYAYYGGR